ncbi:hypothetical protein BJ170DRAFT_599574 [Xylariales sp. AK1849]|nr:hypothetical protein BJ170DRAFT_599574 [Xylariales sp. AK1849]
MSDISDVISAAGNGTVYIRDGQVSDRIERYGRGAPGVAIPSSVIRQGNLQLNSIGNSSPLIPKEHRCPRPTCREVFRTELELEKHQRIETHYRCVPCEQDYATEDALADHREKVHRPDQNLTCPGCGAEFNRGGGLMQHIDHCLCPKITPRFLHAQRQIFVEFSQGLRRLNPANEDFVLVGNMEQPFKDGQRPFTQPDSKIPRYMDSSVYPGLGDDLDKYRSGYSKQPDLLTGEPLKKPVIPPVRQVENKWDSGKPLFPHAEAATTRPTRRELNIYTEPAPAARDFKSTERITDPDTTGYNPAVFYNSILDQFRCPHERCKSKFAKAGSLTAHLRSPAHNANVKFRCPTCLREFASMASALQHAETASRTCNIRETNQFRQFVGNVTGGILDGLNDEGERLADNTPRLIIPQIFLENLPWPAHLPKSPGVDTSKMGRGRMAEWEDEAEEEE